MSDEIEILKKRLDSLESSIEETKRMVIQTQLLMHDIDESLAAAEDERTQERKAERGDLARSSLPGARSILNNLSDASLSSQG
jgi:cob(I)alamin adenosyltransferase